MQPYIYRTLLITYVALFHHTMSVSFIINTQTAAKLWSVHEENFGVQCRHTSGKQSRLIKTIKGFVLIIIKTETLLLCQLKMQECTIWQINRSLWHRRTGRVLLHGKRLKEILLTDFAAFQHPVINNRKTCFFQGVQSLAAQFISSS